MFLIIGGTSFIGVYTANEFIKQGYEVAVAGRSSKFDSYYNEKGIKTYFIDLDDKETFNNIPTGIEGIILLAALQPPNVDADLIDNEAAADYIKTNTLGTAYLLEYCRKHGIKRILHMGSTQAEYGFWDNEIAIKETALRNYRLEGDHAAYLVSKIAASDLLEYYNNQHDMKNITFRIPMVYGVGPHGGLYENGIYRKSAIQIFIENAVKGEDLCIYEDDSIGRDSAYVKDVAKAIVSACISDHAKGLYNITAGRIITFREQAEAIVDVFSKDKRSVIVVDKTKKNSCKSFLFDISKAKEDFGYEPQYTTFFDMMQDYKRELDRGEYPALFGIKL